MSDRPLLATCEQCTEIVEAAEMGYYDPKRWVVICKRCLSLHPSKKPVLRLITNEFIDGEDY